MKLVRFGAHGSEKPGMIDAQGAVRDLSAVVPDIDARTLSPAALARLREIDPAQLPAAPAGVRLGACIGSIPNLVCIGLNYSDHAAETNTPIPSQPIVFNKHTGAAAGPNDALILAPGSAKMDWEVELAVVIGTPAWHVREEDALRHVAGYCLCNDVSERAWQLEYEGQWTKGKSYYGYAPLGPWLVTADEVPDPQDVDLWLDVNGVRRQSGNTRTQIFGIAHIVSYLSRFMALQAGDVIATGTPPGVGLGHKPPLFLKAGDRVALGSTLLGEQRQSVVAYHDEIMGAVARSALAAALMLQVGEPAPPACASSSARVTHQRIEALRKSDGVTPVAFLNAVLKCCAWLKPQSIATSVAVRRGSKRNSLARSRRRPYTKRRGVCPVLSRKARMKCRGLTPATCAKPSIVNDRYKSAWM